MSEFIKPNETERGFSLVGAPQTLETEKKGFVLVDTPEELTVAVSARISQINDLISDNTDPKEMDSLASILREPSNISSDVDNTALLSKYLFKRFGRTDATREELVRGQIFLQYFSQIENRYSDTVTASSYGVFAPTYFRELVSYKTRVGDSRVHKSLLVGALTVNSAQEYLSVVHSVFKNSKSLIIDIDASTLHQLPESQEMDGIHTSFSDKTFDTIHTNYLLHQLRDSEGSNIETPNKIPLLESFFKESHRLLKPNGELIMVESDFGNIFDSNSNNPVPILKEILFRSGFKKISFKRAERFLELSDVARLTRCSFGNTELFKTPQTEIYNYALSIVASK